MRTPLRAAHPGRPRTFDADLALARALDVFWRRGYEGASLAELTTAMGIGKPSLYATFGNKADLFRRALAQYLAGPAAQLAATLEAAQIDDAVAGFLHTAVDLLTDPTHPPGCLVVQAALSCGREAGWVQTELARHRESALQALVARLKRAVTEGQLPADCAVEGLARLLVTLQQGLSVQASSAASRDDLLAVVALALSAWRQVSHTGESP